MSQECSHQTCSHGNQDSHQNHHDHCSRCCHSHCHCECHKHHLKYSEELLKLADEAWMEVLKEKIKEEIRRQSDEHLHQLAHLVASSNHKRWADKLDERKTQDDFDSQLRNLLYKRQSKG